MVRPAGSDGALDLSALLRRVGEALYGPRWQGALAGALGVSDRTMRRWASGADDPPAGVYTDLAGVIANRSAELDALVQECCAAPNEGTP